VNTGSPQTPGANPWRLLPASAGRDIQDRLKDPQRYEWSQEWFRQWVQRFYSKTPPHLEELFPEWRFNHGFAYELDRVNDPEFGHAAVAYAQRNSFLCVYAKLRKEGLWYWVQTVFYAGADGSVHFRPAGGAVELKHYLLTLTTNKEHDYGDWWRANHEPGWDWGLRSRLQGAQLHFRGRESGPGDLRPLVNVHLDLHNPGNSDNPATALGHHRQDLKKRKETHTVTALQEALRAQGVEVFDVH
jgi:hypothetical protein